MKYRHLIPLTLLYITPIVSADKWPVVKPESVNLSSKKLAQVDAAMNRLVKEKKLTGAVMMINRKGKTAHFKPYGKMDSAANIAMQKDTIFRIYSMTKSITTAAALMLYDEGKLDLDDPVGQYLPELNNLKVFRTGQAKNKVTFRDLMRHTSGMIYGFGIAPLDRLYSKKRLLASNQTLEESIKKLGQLPLAFEPGTDWTYGVSIDVLGRLVEVVSGQSLDLFFQKRFFDPLEMPDTGFHVPTEKHDRLAALYNSNGKGRLTVAQPPGRGTFKQPVQFLSGGGGLVSTIGDYMTFLQMIANGGSYNGKRYLKSETVRLMTTNQVPPDAMPVTFGTKKRMGVGYSLGFSIRTKMSKWDPSGRVGEYGWGGMPSCHYWVSPKDDLIVIILEQTMPYGFITEFATKKLIYDAIVKE